MSYDIYLEADLGGPERVSLGLQWNYTSNCGPMWREAGADLAEYHGKRANDCIPSLRAACADMNARPAHYRMSDSPNGWGSYDTLLPRLFELLAAFEAAPDAFVRVSR